MVKIDLITGFLGAGKTTFAKGYIQYLLKQNEKVCVLENDYGAINVDTLLFKEMNLENLGVEMVAGGCDPDCYKRRFKTKLITMALLGYTHVIVEPSGIFDIDVFYDLLNEDELYNRYTITNVFAIVDSTLSTSLSKEAEYLLASQIATSGKIVFSKTSYTTEDKIQNLIEYINAALKKIGCNRVIEKDVCTKDWSDFTDQDYAELSESGYKPVSFRKEPINEEDVFKSLFFMELKIDKEEVLRQIENIWMDQDVGNILRIKGFVQKNNQWYLINSTKDRTEVVCSENGQNLLIVIGEKMNVEKIDSYFPSVHSSFSTLEEIRQINM